MNRFDREAHKWDQPKRLRRARDLAAIIREQLHDDLAQTAMEYGCGTGAVGFELRDCFTELLLVDSSEGMIEQVERKIDELCAPNVTALKWDLSRHPLPDVNVDVVFSTLAFHHVSDVQALLVNLRDVLPRAGRLIVIDLDRDGGFWHQRQDDFEGHDGFDRAELTTWCVQAGFEVRSIRTVYKQERTVGAETRDMPLFLLDAVAV